MTAGRYQFRYIAQRLLDDRTEKAERAAAQPYLDKGYRILAEEPGTEQTSCWPTWSPTTAARSPQPTPRPTRSGGRCG
ncbi:hypothetical protein CJ179_33405 [Rhodococcus sp. ACS1]|jgi:hypothetical protein|uniref:hypothetical protein n=1 Tax=Rhodococcus sp. ACS1 TaxID=2028570 RepID=UPI000BB13FAD|nr:hypothetical protein [Rhodococcus sp. ACS1]PBC40014.1 hypothetical protein CJ179_33405 [Rhodococcus sp. ACS1]